MRTMAVLSVVAGSMALTSMHGRFLSYPPILGYYPASSVTDHNRIDLDQKALESAFGTCATGAASTCTGMSAVKAVYEQGGNSGPQGQCTIAAPGIVTAFSKKAALRYRSSNTGTWIEKKSSASGAVGGTTIKFYYATASTQAHQANECVVGGTAPATTPSLCLGANAQIEFKTAAGAWSGQVYTCTAVDNTQASRTLQGFSTKAKKLMWDPSIGSCPAEVTTKSYKNGCPYTSFKPYWDYYCSGASSSCNGNGGYADSIVQAAIASGSTTLTNGNIDFAQAAGNQLKEVIKKGTAYMHSWMYAIREFEDAIDDCTGNTLTNNDLSSGSVHAWDEGVAFYTGSILETGHLSGASGSSTDGISAINSGIGKQAYDLGNKRCRNFATCGRGGGETEGQSQQNYMLFDLFNEGQVDFRTGNCGAVVPVKNKIVQWMTIPLIQGTLRYAYEVGVASGSNKARAEGTIFALAVLPQVHACSAAHATTIYTNMVQTMSNSGAIDFNAVKAAFEACYATLFPDIAAPCAAVGTYGGSLGTQDLSTTANTKACVDPSSSSSSDDSSTVALAAGIGGGVAALLLLCVLYMVCKEKAGKPVFANLDAKGAAPPAGAKSSA